MTLSIEVVGLLILGIWIVVPVSEFKEILGRLRPRIDRRDRRDDR
jgi:hypothetical protein